MFVRPSAISAQQIEPALFHGAARSSTMAALAVWRAKILQFPPI